MAAACVLASAYIGAAHLAEQPVKVRVDDIQDYEKCLKLDKQFFSTEPDVIILYNLNNNSSRQRLQLAGDLLREFEGVYRAVVATSDSPLAFARDELHHEPQEVYHFEGNPRKVSSR